MIIFLNLGSLIFGLIAWVLPVINIFKYKNVISGMSYRFPALVFVLYLYTFSFTIKII